MRPPACTPGACSTQGFFDHEDPAGNGPADRVKRFAKRRYVIVGENIAAGFDSTGATCRGWMNSPGHRANILRHELHAAIGAGYASGDSEYGRYYVQVFADVARIRHRGGKKPASHVRPVVEAEPPCGATMRLATRATAGIVEGRGRRR